MRHSDLLGKILKMAEEIRLECGLQHISAPILIGACSEFQSQRYTGLDTILYPERYEEERLRLAYSAIYKLHASRRSFFGRMVKDDAQRLDKPFDFAEAITIAQQREKAALSADLVFLSAVSSVAPEDRSCLPIYRCPLHVPEMMAALDEKICDYVIGENEKLVAELTKKIGEATALRDWKPARKFKEPEELAAEFFGKIKSAYANKTLTIQIPKFFGDGNLKLSIWCADGIYYLHDNASAVRCLKKRVQDEEKLQRILKKVCNKQWLQKDCIYGCFTAPHTFFWYLQKLIMVAHGELVYTKLCRQVFPYEKGYTFGKWSDREDFDHRGLLEQIKNQIHFNYDENLGLYMHVATTYSLNSTTVSYLLETVSDRDIRLSDRRKGKLEGEILESLYLVYDDITPCAKRVDSVIRPFGGYIYQNNIYLTEKQNNWYFALTRFINMAVLLSEFGHLVNVSR